MVTMLAVDAEICQLELTLSPVQALTAEKAEDSGHRQCRRGGC